MDEQHADRPWSAAQLSDERLLALLRAAIPRMESPPADTAVLAKQSFGLRSLDAELAALTADSAGSADSAGIAELTLALRGPADDEVRLMTFESPGLAIDVQVSRTGRFRRIVGQLIPSGPARICVRQSPGPGPDCVDADEYGRFAVEGLRPGPASITCDRPDQPAVRTAWTSLD